MRHEATKQLQRGGQGFVLPDSAVTADFLIDRSTGSKRLCLEAQPSGGFLVSWYFFMARPQITVILGELRS